jgi:hypothetical protein
MLCSRSYNDALSAYNTRVNLLDAQFGGIVEKRNAYLNSLIDNSCTAETKIIELQNIVTKIKSIPAKYISNDISSGIEKNICILQKDIDNCANCFQLWFKKEQTPPAVAVHTRLSFDRLPNNLKSRIECLLNKKIKPDVPGIAVIEIRQPNSVANAVRPILDAVQQPILDAVQQPILDADWNECNLQVIN